MTDQTATAEQAAREARHEVERDIDRLRTRASPRALRKRAIVAAARLWIRGRAAVSSAAAKAVGYAKANPAKLSVGGGAVLAAAGLAIGLIVMRRPRATGIL